MKILLTGATGFIGSHIAEVLLNNGFELILTKRSQSSLLNCTSFLGKVTFIDTDNADWFIEVCNLAPSMIIHAAWNGVLSKDRDTWESQLSNIDLVTKLLFIAEKCHITKFIGLGSQAEYGLYSGVISEKDPINPTTKYGYLKIALSHQISSYCELNKINWYWLRIFSVFGERESENWLIPSVIIRMLNEEKQMDFTLGEQQYAYLYVRDLANAILKVCSINGPSGIYNISSSKAISLRKLLLIIRDKINPAFKLNFGVLPYRINQSMHIEGNSSKFISKYGSFEESSIECVLDQVINYYKSSNETI